MPKNKKNNRDKSDEEINFEQELAKLKLSAERGIPYVENKREDLDFDAIEESNMWKHLSLLDKVLKNPEEGDEKLVKDFLQFTDYPKEKDLSDAELSAALESVTTALALENILLDVIHPTPEREVYRFITEELLFESVFSPEVSGMTTHFIYEEFYPNHSADIESVIKDTLHFICRGYKSGLPWQIAFEVSLYGKKVSQEEFETFLGDHREVYIGMSFIGVDSINIRFDEDGALAKASFRYYLDHSSGTPGEEKAEADFYFELFDDCYLLNRLVIPQLGIQ